MRPPQFTQKLRNLTVNDGEQLELMVKVDGDPEPQITWNKDGKVNVLLYKSIMETKLNTSWNISVDIELIGDRWSQI